jgi:hypothetical protein
MTPLELAELVCSDLEPDWRAITAVAVIIAESAGNEHAVNLVNHDPTSPAYESLDLGILQINTYWHGANITAYDSFVPQRAWAYALTLIVQPDQWGHDWTQWTAFNNGAFVRYLGEARTAVNIVRGSGGLEPL